MAPRAATGADWQRRQAQASKFVSGGRRAGWRTSVFGAYRMNAFKRRRRRPWEWISPRQLLVVVVAVAAAAGSHEWSGPNSRIGEWRPGADVTPLVNVSGQRF